MLDSVKTQHCAPSPKMLITYVGLMQTVGEGEAIAQDGAESLHAAKKATWKDYLVHALMVFWRVTFAIIPPECTH